MQDECDELEGQLSKLDLNLRREEESVQQRRKQLEQAERVQTGVILGHVIGGIIGGLTGLAVGGAIATSFYNIGVSNADEAVAEALNQVTRKNPEKICYQGNRTSQVKR